MVVSRLLVKSPGTDARITPLRIVAGTLLAALLSSSVALSSQQTASQRSIVFILVDDLRYDALSYLGHPFLETPNIDRLAQNGLLFENAFVTTSLCSPSRASILSGQYAHKHRVLDNNTDMPLGVATFPVVLNRAGYRTAFVGKWHMGGQSDSPRPGFDRWVSFPGQGSYHGQRLNIDGEHVEQDGYITDVLTRYAVDFIESVDEEPFLLYLSHKAVHSPFAPAARHLGSYAGKTYPHPASMANTDQSYDGKPAWVRAQRMSWHGVDGMYNQTVDFNQFVLDYSETVRAVDDSVGEVVAALERQGLLDSTLLVFTSDNGFQFGEHGLIDKRTMYEASIRVPLIVFCPELIESGRRERKLITNVDFAPTFIEAAGADIPDSVQGRSFLGLLDGDVDSWRDAFLYEYFWERMFPQTPTVLGVRTERYKLMKYHGVWDRYELYDLVADPDENNNLIGEFMTRNGIGHVEQRIIGAPASRPNLIRLFGPGSEDTKLKELFIRLHDRLNALLVETECASEPNWLPN